MPDRMLPVPPARWERVRKPPPLPALLLGGLLTAAAPALAQTASPQPKLPALLSALQKAPSAADAAMLEVQIEQVWLNAGTASVTLLMSRALRELKAGEDKDAIEDFGAAIDLQPELPEPWAQRALARYHMGDVTGAVKDLQEALQREPRHFPSLRLLSIIAENRGDWQGAYDAWKKLMDIDPRTAGGEERLKQLRIHALGEET
jgi:tetratricopeptide (TPR) repeat protein